MASIRAKVRERTDRSYAHLSLESMVERLNRALRGWGNYFRYGNSSRKFDAVDSYVHMRLARLASIKHGRSGRNWATRYNYAWFSRLRLYRLSGTVRYGSANASR